MPYNILFLCLILFSSLRSQYLLTKEDKDVTEFKILLSDSIYKINNYDFKNTDLSSKNGLWVLYFDENLKECTKNKHKFKRIVFLKNGYSIQKQYFVDENMKLLTIYENYPEISYDSIFIGFKEMNYSKKGKITAVTLHKFLNDSLYQNKKYLHLTKYYANQKVKSFSFLDELTGEQIYLEFNKNGVCTNELRYSKEESSKIKRNKTGKKVSVEKKINGAYYQLTFINGKEVKRKKLY